MGGEVYITRGVCDLLKEHNISSARFRKILFLADDFNEDNDPYGEHDFWAVKIAWKKLLWKIDYYDQNREYHSPDPSNEKLTVRVLTILTPNEY